MTRPVGAGGASAPVLIVRVTVRRHLPGRTRLGLDAWPGENAARDAAQRLRAGGVELVAVNPLTRSVLARHPTAMPAAAVVARLIAAFGLTDGGAAGAIPCQDRGAGAPAPAPEVDLDQAMTATPEALLRRLGGAREGLSAEQAAARLLVHGPNLTPRRAGGRVWPSCSRWSRRCRWRCCSVRPRCRSRPADCSKPSSRLA